MRKILIGLMMAGCYLAGNAQSTDTDKAIQAMHKLTTVYQQAKLLSFDVTYTYAAEDKPSVYLDSLKGECKLDGSRYWSGIDNTISVCDNSMLVMLFREDSIMYLVKPGAQATANPAAMLDSFLLKNNNIQYSYTATATEQRISLSMPGSGACKKMTYYIDPKTGYITRMSSLVRSDQLYDPSVRSLVADAAAVYVLVDAVYTNYKQGGFEETVFDMARYYRKEGKDYVTVAPYNNYKVFLGTPGL